MLIKEFRFFLQDELIYSHDDKANIAAKMLLLRAPTTKLLSLAHALRSIVSSALMKAREHYKDEKENKISSKGTTDLDGESVYLLVSSSFNDFTQAEKFVDLFKELILSESICLVDGKEPLTSYLLDNLDSRETLRLMGEYIANFLLPSVMNQSQKKK